jgi:hypothetical protein
MASSSSKSVKRPRRTLPELYVDKLRAISGPEKKLISNHALRDALDWEEERYERVKAQLLTDGQIVVGKGYSGSVALARGPGVSKTRLFISYSHLDENLKIELEKHLEPLRRIKLITAWSDRKLIPGDDWGSVISSNLEEAQVVLLLVSIDFINSEYCYDIEMDRAMARNNAGQCVVIPIILRGCLWQHTPFSKLQALPQDGLPVTSLPDRDRAFASVADGVRIAVEELIARQRN